MRGRRGRRSRGLICFITEENVYTLFTTSAELPKPTLCFLHLDVVRYNVCQFQFTYTTLTAPISLIRRHITTLSQNPANYPLKPNLNSSIPTSRIGSWTLIRGPQSPWPTSTTAVGFRIRTSHPIGSNPPLTSCI